MVRSFFKTLLLGFTLLSACSEPARLNARRFGLPLNSDDYRNFVVTETRVAISSNTETLAAIGNDRVRIPAGAISGDYQPDLVLRRLDFHPEAQNILSQSPLSTLEVMMVDTRTNTPIPIDALTKAFTVEQSIAADMVSDQSKLGLVIMSAVDYQEYEEKNATPQAPTGIYRSTNSFFLPNSRITISQDGDQITIEVTLSDPVALVLPFADASDIPAAIPEYPIIEVSPDVGDGSGEGDADGDGVGDTIDGNASGDVDGTNDDGTGEADGDDGTGDGDGVGDADGDDSSGVGAGDGGAQDSNTWLALSTVDAPPARYDHTAIWTGEHMIVWGGQLDGSLTNDGGVYNPQDDSWTATSLSGGSGAPSNRRAHSAVWTGDKMIVWGGATQADETNTGAIYDPLTDTWSTISTTNAPASRSGHVAVWTGDRMIVWGGVGIGLVMLNSGGIYDPSTDTWEPITATEAPTPRNRHTATWTGTSMIIWGGLEDGNSPIASGGFYSPSGDSWLSTELASSPSPRFNHTVIWDGSSMIVWGGTDDNDSTSFGNGFLLDPIENTWSAISTVGAPEARNLHTAIWTGDRMLIWGGAIDGATINSGGSYNKSLDTWTALTTTNAPFPRKGHTAVWTGTRMIVWGGWYWNGAVSSFNTGGIYKP